MLQTPLPLILCFFRRLESVLEVLWAQEIPQDTPFIVPAVVFYDGSINYYNMDRLGGVISDLNKTFRPELRKRLGSGHPLVQGNGPQSLGMPCIAYPRMVRYSFLSLWVVCLGSSRLYAYPAIKICPLMELQYHIVRLCLVKTKQI